MMIYGRAYFKGDVVGELTDIGFSNVDEVISELVKQLPKDIPIGCTVQFRLKIVIVKERLSMKEAKAKDFSPFVCKSKT